MLFPTVSFAIFLVVVMVVSWALRPHRRLWKWFLLASGLVFYGSWDWRFVPVLMLVIAATHLSATAMGKWPSRRRALLTIGVSIDLAILGFLKYYGFFASSFQSVFQPLGWSAHIPLVEVILPIGISFYVFESIAYLVEIHRGMVQRLPLLDLTTYLSFFPKILSGPITRPSEFEPQLVNPIPASRLDGPAALWLLGRGLFKKMVIASYLIGAIIEGVFATPGEFSALETLAGIYGYTALIYIDFSAYTDMARGAAMLLGFTLPENFRHPYTATSIHDFWNRWHMSLTRWVRDFLFQPLFLAHHRGRAARLGIILAVMTLVGLWHGAAWTFVIWGGIHGLALVVERARRERRRAHGLGPIRDTAWVRLRRRLVTFNIVAFAWVFFRADSISGALDVFSRLASWGPAPAVTPMLVLVLVAVFAMQYFPDDWSTRIANVFRVSGPVAQSAALGVLLLIVDTLGPQGVPQFIYTRF